MSAKRLSTFILLTFLSQTGFGASGANSFLELSEPKAMGNGEFRAKGLARYAVSTA
jgi:hypothetical protein